MHKNKWSLLSKEFHQLLIMIKCVLGFFTFHTPVQNRTDTYMHNIHIGKFKADENTKPIKLLKSLKYTKTVPSKLKQLELFLIEQKLFITW